MRFVHVLFWGDMPPWYPNNALHVLAEPFNDEAQIVAMFEEAPFLQSF